MGSSAHIVCTNCSYDKVFMIGQMHPAFGQGEQATQVIEAFISSKKTRAVIQQLLAEKGDSGFMALEQALYRCPNCFVLAQRVKMTISFSDATTYEVPFACWKCKGELQYIKEVQKQLASWPCPSCHEKTLTTGNIHVMWD